eukprot:CAMPEP_0181324486 /NCGR_PEP_ID=MMETSP1101-20121128/20387_1 /TAXON_ID=46948 /ORGANISM="Rhodomonas abbreviata, Strain Caron Lab Isolate" /LENGTH=635 /DNA_ID=CAMNT_0023432669 /DNA_START=13 /DNA_END=1920 /DNA_ORIENTATION=+
MTMRQLVVLSLLVVCLPAVSGHYYRCGTSSANACVRNLDDLLSAPTTCDGFEEQMKLYSDCYAEHKCCHRMWREDNDAIALKLQSEAVSGCQVPPVQCDAENMHWADSESDVEKFIRKDLDSETLQAYYTSGCDGERLSRCLVAAQHGTSLHCDGAAENMDSFATCFHNAGCCAIWEPLAAIQLEFLRSENELDSCPVLERTCGANPEPAFAEAEDPFLCDPANNFQDANGRCQKCSECSDGEYMAKQCEFESNALCVACPDGLCEEKVELKFSTSLQFASVDAFDEDEQLKYREGVAVATRVPVEDVSIVSVTPILRRSLVSISEHFSCEASVVVPMGGKTWAFCEGQLWEVPKNRRRAGEELDNRGIEVVTQVKVVASESDNVVSLTLDALNEALETKDATLATGGVIPQVPEEKEEATKEVEEEKKQEEKQEEEEEKQEPSSKHHKKKKGYGCGLSDMSLEAALGIVGGLSLFALIVAVLCCKRKRQQQQQPAPRSSALLPRTASPPASGPLHSVASDKLDGTYEHAVIANDGSSTGMLVLAVAPVMTASPFDGDVKEALALSPATGIVVDNKKEEEKKKSEEEKQEPPPVQEEAVLEESDAIPGEVMSDDKREEEEAAPSAPVEGDDAPVA